MNPRTRSNRRTSAKVLLRIRPGRMIIIRPPLLRALGADPSQLMVAHEGNRLVISRRPSPQEASLARFKARLSALSLTVGACTA